MKIQAITVTIGQTMNLGDYQSVRTQFSITGELEEGDSSDDCARRLNEAAEAHLNDLALRMLQGWPDYGQAELHDWLSHLNQK